VCLSRFLWLQEKEAARKRAEADKKAAKMQARLDQLKQQSEALQQQVDAKQAALKLELQAKKMERQLQLDVRGSFWRCIDPSGQIHTSCIQTRVWSPNGPS
jgi:hypothetical protein